ncbi:MAG TPA: DivIVA domain-containing protein [Cytophagales bacterium]|nr:DivIVA domain-containing protein [Cytophagales bacterium]
MENIYSGDISNKKFNSVFRGYDKNEVNNFLLILSKEFEILEKDIIHLKEKISDYKNESDKFQNVESSLISTLKTAEDASLKINDQAKKDADLILKNSELECEKTINNANLKAESVLHKAELETKQIISDSKEEVLKIKKEFESLTALKNKFINELKSLSNLTNDALNKFNNDSKFNYDNKIDDLENFTNGLLNSENNDSDEINSEENLPNNVELDIEVKEDENIREFNESDGLNVIIEEEDAEIDDKEENINEEVDIDTEEEVLEELVEKVDLNDELKDNIQDEGEVEEKKNENSRDSKENDESKKTNSSSLGNQKSFFDTFDEN